MQLHPKYSVRYVSVLLVILCSQNSLAVREGADGTLPFHITDRTLSSDQLSAIQAAIDSFRDTPQLDAQNSTSNETVVVEEPLLDQNADSEPKPQADVEAELVEQLIPDEETSKKR